MAATPKASPPVIKTEPNVTVKSERLSSFRVPRDLTLGGTGPSRTTRGGVSKKVFTPNLNAVRNKNTDVKTSRDTTLRGRGRSDRGRGNDRGRGRGGRAMIQTMGVFSEGVLEGVNRRSGSGYSSRVDTSEGPQQLRKPTICHSTEKFDPELESKNIRHLLGDSDEEDDKFIVKDKIKKRRNKTLPVMLKDPKVELIKVEPNRFPVPVTALANGQIKTEVVDAAEAMQIKEESQSIVDSKIGIQAAVMHNSGYPESLQEIFSSIHPQYFLLQLPDTLPGQSPEAPPPETTVDEKPIPPPLSSTFCTMKDLEDGILGKLIRYKSGKTKLVLGETKFDVQLGMEPGLMQDIVSVTTNDSERSGDMVHLGQVSAKLSATPDWEFLFSNFTTL